MTELLYPLGHPVRIAADERRVLEVAHEQWGGWAPRFDVPAMEFRIETVAGDVSGTARYEAFDSGFLLCGDGGDRAGFSLERGSGWARLTEATIARDGLWWDFLQPLVITALDWTYFLPVHGACVKRGERSVVLCGHSGAGKSTLAYACARAGWTFVSDDALHWAVAQGVMIPGTRRLYLREPAKVLFPEIADLAVSQADNGKLAVEVSVEGAGEAPLGPLVFLERCAGGAGLVEVEARTAREYLWHYCPRPVADYDALLRCGAWRLRYELVKDAVDTLERLV